MSNRIFLAGIAVAFVSVVLIISYRMSQRDARYMEASVKVGLEQLYTKLTKDQAQGPNVNFFTVERLNQALLVGLKDWSLPGFVKIEDISISATGINRGTTNLLCTVEWSGIIYGLDGIGKVKLMSQTQYQNWSHLKLRQE